MPLREREGEGERKEGKPGAEAVEAAFRDQEGEASSSGEEEDARYFQKNPEEAEAVVYIWSPGFGRDAVEAGKIVEDLHEADSNESCYK